MANYSSIKATVNAYIKQNGLQQITGTVMNAVLTAIIDALGDGYRFKGVVTPSSAAITTDNKVWVLALTAGTYTNFGGLTVSSGEYAVLTYDTSWAKISVPVYVKPSTGIPTTDLNGTAQEAIYTASDIFIANTDTTGEELEEALGDGKMLFFVDYEDDYRVYAYDAYDEQGGEYVFIAIGGYDATNQAHYLLEARCDGLGVWTVADNVGTIYKKPSTGIPSTDMASAVRTSLGKADTAEQAANKKTNLNDNSDTYYPSQKAVKTVTDALDDRIDNISTMGRFLSVWSCQTGLPFTEPTSTPYAYRTGDYFIVGQLAEYPQTIWDEDNNEYLFVGRETEEGNYDALKYECSGEYYYVSPNIGGIIYSDEYLEEPYANIEEALTSQLMPSGSSYTGAASTTEGSENTGLNDIFRYDGTRWTLIDLPSRDVAWGTITGTLSSQTDLNYALNARVKTADIATSITSSSTNAKVAGAKAVYDALSAIDKIFIATYGTTTYAEILAAFNADKVILLSKNDGLYVLSYKDSTGFYFFNSTSIAYLYKVSTDNVWSVNSWTPEKTHNKATTITDNDTYYPTCGAVVDYVDSLNIFVGTTATTYAQFKAAADAGKAVFLSRENRTFSLYSADNSVIYFGITYGDSSRTCYVTNNDTWSAVTYTRLATA